MEDFVRQTLLFDFYGELLTEHQQQVFRDVYFGDMSLSEVAEIHGISRQGVHDLIKRCNKQLQSYEDKLMLVRKFLDIRSKTEQIYQDAQNFIRDAAGSDNTAAKTEISGIEEIVKLCGEILEEL